LPADDQPVVTDAHRWYQHSGERREAGAVDVHADWLESTLLESTLKELNRI
jgi:hypothetical protein